MPALLQQHGRRVEATHGACGNYGSGYRALAQALNVWIALVERRGAWAGVRGSAEGALSSASATAEADVALEAAAIGGVAAHIDGLAALLAVPGTGDERASQVSSFTPKFRSPVCWRWLGVGLLPSWPAYLPGKSSGGFLFFVM